MIAAAVATLTLLVAPPADAPQASALKGAQAYVAYANAHGGVHGAKVVLTTDPTLPAVAALGPSDDPSLPQLLGYAPPPRAEGEAYGRYLAALAPDAQVGVLWAGDDTGRALLAGLRRAAARQIVAAERIDPSVPDVATQVGALQAAGADTLVVLAPDFAADAYAALADLRWKPQLVAAASTETPPAGTVSAAWLSADSALFKTVARSNDRFYLAGLSAAFTAVDVLRRAGAAPTSASVAKAAAALVEANNPFLLPGVVVRAQPATARLALARWTRGRWVVFGGLLTARA